jgi:diguanylate cyclase (GGDEF)-like protein/PAS domain S-box-containing protein
MQDPRLLLRVVLQSVRDAVLVTDEAARLLSMNPAAEALTGWAGGEIVGQPVETVVSLFESTHGEDGVEGPILNPAYVALRDADRKETLVPALLIAKGGRRVSVQVSATRIEEADNLSGCLLVLHDVTEALQLAQRLAYLAQHDSLTGLPNRILLVDRLDQATKLADRLAEQLAVVFLDIDQFHLINDRYGRAAGDQFLKEAAYRLTDALRESDTVCRLGADEFVILLSGVKSAAAVETIAAKLLAEIARPYLIGDQTIQTSCSMGISLYPADANDGSTLMRLADGALQQAKVAGKNQFSFTKSDMARAVVE